MKTKNIIIIIIILALIAVVGFLSYIYLTQPVYKNITMNGVTMEVKDSNMTVLNQTDLFSIYNDTENGVYVMVFDSEPAGISDLSEATTFAFVREAFQVDAQIQKEGNYTYNYSNSLKQYTYLTNYTHKNVFIVTNNKEDMQHILDTIRVEVDINLNSTNNTENETNTTETTSTSTQSSQSSSSSYSSEDNYDSYADEDAVFVVNPKTGKKEYGPAHPNYGTPNDYLYEEHRKYVE